MDGEPIGPLALRGMLFILPAPVFFGLAVRGLGFVPSLFFTALIAAFASSRMKPGMASAVAAVITVFSAAVFGYALGPRFEQVDPWTQF